MPAYTANGKRISSMTHAKRSVTCVCGKVCRGNGGWSSHRRACGPAQEARHRAEVQAAKDEAAAINAANE